MTTHYTVIPIATSVFSDTTHVPLFNGKDKDEEIGYSYFGARYYDAELMTMWLSVDPMADKKPPTTASIPS